MKTRRSARRNAAQIDDIQSTTQCAAQNISAIVHTTEEANRVAQSIAAAVSQQGEVTAEIARNLQQASKGAQAVNDNIGGVLSMAERFSRLEPDARLGGNAGAAVGSIAARGVDAFLDAVRAA